jgi:hypothetical protein
MRIIENLKDGLKGLVVVGAMAGGMTAEAPKAEAQEVVRSFVEQDPSGFKWVNDVPSTKNWTLRINSEEKNASENWIKTILQKNKAYKDTIATVFANALMSKSSAGKQKIIEDPNTSSVLKFDERHPEFKRLAVEFAKFKNTDLTEITAVIDQEMKVSIAFMVKTKDKDGQERQFAEILEFVENPEILK